MHGDIKISEILEMSYVEKFFYEIIEQILIDLLR